MLTGEGIKKLAIYFAIIIAILIIINIVVGYMAMSSSGTGFPTGYQGWYLVYTMMMPAINAVITGLSIGFGFLIGWKLLN